MFIKYSHEWVLQKVSTPIIKQHMTTISCLVLQPPSQERNLPWKLQAEILTVQLKHIACNLEHSAQQVCFVLILKRERRILQDWTDTDA